MLLGIVPPAECDECGVPLDWERCRACEGTGRRFVLNAAVSEARARWGGAPIEQPGDEPCDACGGRGSLKAAALHAWRMTSPALTVTLDVDEVADSLRCRGRYAIPHDPFTLPRDVRCEDCGHPMSEGTWVAPDAEVPRLDTAGLLTGVALQALRQGVPDWENGLAAVHYSPCDSGCRHGGPMRALLPDGGWRDVAVPEPVAPDMHTQVVADYGTLWASWRPVDVRCLSWPHDLRLEMLAVLCLRCWAAREMRGGGNG